MEPWDVDEVSSGFVEVKSRLNMLACEHDLGFRTSGADVAQELEVAGTAEDVISDAAYHELGFLDACMAQRVGVCDVAIDTGDAAAAQLFHHRGDEVDDQQLVEQNLRLDRAHRIFTLGDAWPRLPHFQVTDAKELESAAQQLLDVMARLDHVGRDHGGDRKGQDHDRDDARVDLGRGSHIAKRRNHDRELADLREVDGREQARAVAQTKRVEDRNHGQAADDHKG